MKFPGKHQAHGFFDYICRHLFPAQLAVLVLAGGLLGCKSSSPSRYVAPRVIGYVLDARSQQPIRNVKVLRLESSQSANTMDLKGGQQMHGQWSAQTAADGAFDLKSERTLALAQRIGWYSISLSFEHAGYQSFITNFTLASATNSAKGEPVVNAGKILLDPRGNN